MSKRMTLTLVLALIFFITSCSPGATTTNPSATASIDGTTLLQERCSRCHTLSRVERARHTSDEWKAIIDNMISRGAILSAEEETVLVEHLAANFGK